MIRKFLKEQNGDTNFISILIVLVIVILAVVLFKPYAKLFVEWIKNLIF